MSELKIIEGKTTPESLLKYLNEFLDGQGEVSICAHGIELRKDIQKWIDENHMKYGMGQAGIVLVIDHDEGKRYIENYTWAFGQKTKRRLNKFVKKYKGIFESLNYEYRENIMLALEIYESLEDNVLEDSDSVEEREEVVEI
tara:strand:+ start:625 stop:1050 length:426 start_codon:yes stop_codon:yes gene_type:complete